MANTNEQNTKPAIIPDTAPRNPLEALSDHDLLDRFIRAIGSWAPGASGICIDLGGDMARQTVLRYRDEVGRRLTERRELLAQRTAAQK